jgi:hypothetical protein
VSSLGGADGQTTQAALSLDVLGPDGEQVAAAGACYRVERAAAAEQLLARLWARDGVPARAVELMFFGRFLHGTSVQALPFQCSISAPATALSSAKKPTVQASSGPDADTPASSLFDTLSASGLTVGSTFSGGRSSHVAPLFVCLRNPARAALERCLSEP